MVASKPRGELKAISLVLCGSDTSVEVIVEVLGA